MPVEYLSALTATARTQRANLHLGIALAFVAGALNAGGFLAIGQYTSHMTGVLSSAADDLVLGKVPHAIAGILSLCAFLVGAMTTALMVNFARRSQPDSAVTYTAPLLRSLGIYLNIYPAKGYSATMALKRPNDASVVSLLDDTRKIAISRLGDTIRVAGTAEMAGYDTALDTPTARARCAAHGQPSRGCTRAGPATRAAARAPRQ